MFGCVSHLFVLQSNISNSIVQNHIKIALLNVYKNLVLSTELIM